MSELHSIPLTCEEGVYSVFDFYSSANFQYAVEIMSKHIERHALPALRRTEDFNVIREYIKNQDLQERSNSDNFEIGEKQYERKELRYASSRLLQQPIKPTGFRR